MPACPAALESNVLRRLRLARAEEKEPFWIDWLIDAFQQTRYAAAAVAVVLLTSTTASVVVASAHASSAERHSLASDALGFDVFREARVLNLDN